MVRSKVDRDRELSGRRRLRIPAALAVVLVGSSATAAMTIGGCDGDSPRTDAGSPMMSTIDAKTSDTPDADEPNAVVDAGMDKGDGPVDAAVPRDAPPDTPVG